MYDRKIPVSRFCALASWGAVGGLLGASWFTWATGGDADVSILLGLTACATSAAAATAQVRCYAIHVATLVRLAGHLGPTEPRMGRSGLGLRSVND